MTRALYWLRFDLRLTDNPALVAACASDALLPVFIFDTTDPRHGPKTLGGASKWWLHHSLKKLGAHIPVTLCAGDPLTLLPQLIEKHDITDVFFTRSPAPHQLQQETLLTETLEASVHIFDCAYLHPLDRILNKSKKPFQVFTPYWRAARQVPLAETVSPPSKPTFILPEHPLSDVLDSWDLCPSSPDWAAGFHDVWHPGEDGARQRLNQFIQNDLQHYEEKRDFPSEHAISRLSPHLHFGEISPRTIWETIERTTVARPELQASADKFLAELGWRDFSAQLLYHHPTLPDQNFNPLFDGYPWMNTPAFLEAWQQGQTGYPLIDAGLRELWQTGFMHNRVRMAVASFLVKHLGIHWKEGERWFWDTLVDADLASNSASWQWVAGSGADAAPFFRVFNPTTQAQKFDPSGAYIRHWVPELAKLSDQDIHAPWQASPLELMAAGIVLGKNYPLPLIDQARGREEAIRNYKELRAGQ